MTTTPLEIGGSIGDIIGDTTDLPVPIPTDPSPVLVSIRVDADFGAGFVDISDLIVNGVKADWGIHGSTPKDRVADPGSMSFELDNMDGAFSGGVGGFGLGTPVRLVLVNSLLGEKTRWQGTVTNIQPSAGIQNPIAAITCGDWMDEAERAHLSLLPVQTNVQADALFVTLLGAVDKAPPNGYRAGSGSDVYPYALDNTQDESTKILDEIQKLVLSEYGLAYVDAGVLVFEGRRLRGGEGSIRYRLDENENIVAMTTSHSRDDIINRAQVSIHPRRVDAAATAVLFNLGSPIQIFRGTSKTFDCPYRDPNQQAQRVGGKDMVDPVATTDYLFNAASDGSGTNLTAQLGFSVTFGGNSATVTVSNDGPEDGYLTFFRLRGRGLYDFEPVISDAVDAPSFAAFGENVFPFDMPYQSSADNAADLASFIVSLNKDESTRVLTVTFLANWDQEAAEQAFNLSISNRVSITAPSVGMNAVPHYVNGFSLEISQSGIIQVTLSLGPVSTAQFWILDVEGRTELDETTVLGYGLFVPGWILDTSTLGTDTFLN